jgi:hypothetical protein
MNYNDYPNYSIYWCDGGNWKVYKGGGSQRRAFATLEEARNLVLSHRTAENKRFKIFANYQAVIVRYDSQYRTEIIELL